MLTGENDSNKLRVDATNFLKNGGLNYLFSKISRKVWAGP